MFVDQSDGAMIGAAIDAGVSAYVVDGLRKDRVRPILELAIRRYKAFSNLRSELEEARTAKLIGSSLEAHVRLEAKRKTFELLESRRDELRYLFIVSQVSLTLLEEEAAGEVRVGVERAAGQKCERCWNYSTLVGEFTRYPTACERCVEALAEIEAEGGAR
jgi:isoleucyl-tRNA synthetase